MQFGSASDEAEAAGHNGDICPRPTTTHGADPDAKIGRFLLFVGIRRGDNAQNPSAFISGSFSQCSFFPRKERALAQRSVRIPLGREKFNVKDMFFLFPILSFSCKRKNGRRKKNAIQDRCALFHCAAFGGTCGGLLRNAACPVAIRRRADDIRPYEHDPTLEFECRGAACCSRFP